MVSLIILLLCCSISSGDEITISDLQTLDLTIDGDVEFPDTSTECLLSDKMTFTVYTCPNKNSFAIILVSNANDISKTIKFITNYDTEFRIKSGGNSFAGISKCVGCITINLERMQNINYKLGTDINKRLNKNDVYIEVESGVKMKDLVNSFQTNNYGNIRVLHSPGSDVAAGGFYQAGSHSESVKKYGYASDYVVGVELILYDGTIAKFFQKHKNKKDRVCYKDLLWALRGSGGGSYGIITKYYLKTIPLETSDTILIYDIKYGLIHSNEIGVAILKRFQYFVENTNNDYHLSCSIGVSEPSIEEPYGYFILFNGKYIGNEISEANQTIYDLLLNDIAIYATNISIKYPPNEYNVNNFAGFGNEERPAVLNSRLIESFDILTDDFYDSLMNYYISNYFVDGSKCICNPLMEFPECQDCIPGINDLLTCCGVGSTLLFNLYGDSVYNSDPNNCLTSSPNRNYIGKLTLTVGTVDTSLFDVMKESVLTPLLNVGINNIFSYLGNQNFIGYRDEVDPNLEESYYGGKTNKKILKRLKKIKCKYDPNNIFHHKLSIPTTDSCFNN